MQLQKGNKNFKTSYFVRRKEGGAREVTVKQVTVKQGKWSLRGYY